MKHGISPTTSKNRRHRMLWVSRARAPLMVRDMETGQMVRAMEKDPISGKEVPAFHWPKGRTYNAGKNQAKRQRRAYSRSLRGPSFTPRGTPHGNPTLH